MNSPKHDCSRRGDMNPVRFRTCIITLFILIHIVPTFSFDALATTEDTLKELADLNSVKVPSRVKRKARSLLESYYSNERNSEFQSDLDLVFKYLEDINRKHEANEIRNSFSNPSANPITSH